MLLFFILLGRLPGSTLFPYTTLFRSWGQEEVRAGAHAQLVLLFGRNTTRPILPPRTQPSRSTPPTASMLSRDRKSTRLNSSHRCISYAVFCLKKKKSRNIRAYT